MTQAKLLTASRPNVSALVAAVPEPSAFFILSNFERGRPLFDALNTSATLFVEYSFASADRAYKAELAIFIIASVRHHTVSLPGVLGLLGYTFVCVPFIGRAGCRKRPGICTVHLPLREEQRHHSITVLANSASCYQAHVSLAARGKQRKRGRAFSDLTSACRFIMSNDLFLFVFVRMAGWKTPGLQTNH